MACLANDSESSVHESALQVLDERLQSRVQPGGPGMCSCTGGEQSMVGHGWNTTWSLLLQPGGGSGAWRAYACLKLGNRLTSNHHRLEPLQRLYSEVELRVT